MLQDITQTPRLRCGENFSVPDGTKTIFSTSSAICDSPAPLGEVGFRTVQTQSPSHMRSPCSPGEVNWSLQFRSLPYAIVLRSPSRAEKETGRAMACGVSGNEIHTGIEARLGSLPLAMLTHREAGNDKCWCEKCSMRRAWSAATTAGMSAESRPPREKRSKLSLTDRTSPSALPALFVLSRRLDLPAIGGMSVRAL